MPNTRPSIVLASRNLKKVAEMAALLEPFQIAVQSVAEFADVPEVVEDGQTFGENACKKASQTAKHLLEWAIGEDSGLSVDALKGAPGIYSARFSGDNATDDLNNQKLIRELEGVPAEKRGAHYVCHVAVADPAGTIQLQVEATCHGRVANAARGSNGFGYDPYFLIREYNKTFGELSPVVKRHLSHRARAFERLIPQLVRLITS